MTSDPKVPVTGIFDRTTTWLQTERGVMALAILVGFALRIFAQPIHSYVGDDSDDYAAFAQGLRLMFAGDAWRDTPAAGGGYGYSPGYPVVTAVFSYVTGNIWVAARAISLTAGLAVIYATYVFGRDLFGSRVGLIAAWVIALSSVMVGQSARTATEMMFVLLILIALVQLLRSQQNSYVGAVRARSMWIAGTAVALAALTRPEGFVVGAVLAVVIVLQSKRIVNVVPILVPGVLITAVWASSGLLRYFIDHYRGVNSAVDAGLSTSQFLTQLASQSFHVAMGNLTALGLVVMVLTVCGAVIAWRQPANRSTIVILVSIPVFVGLFLIVTPGLGDMNRYIAIMVPVWAVFAGYAVVYSIEQLGVDAFRSGTSRWVFIAVMSLVVASVFNARAIGERSLTWSGVASAQSASLDWIAANSGSSEVSIFDLAGLAQLNFADDSTGYTFEWSPTVELEILPRGYDFVVVQQLTGERHKSLDYYVPAAEVSAFQGHEENLVYTIYIPLSSSIAGSPVRIRAEQVDTVWNRFWRVK